MSELTFEPPGPGTWELDAEHYPRPASRYKQELLTQAMDAGVTAGASRYGVLVERKTEIVNGFPYATQKPVEGATDPEAASASKMGEETEYQRRVAAAAEAFETKLWRTELERWDSEWKPEIRSTQRSLQEVSLGKIDDERLIDHVETCREAFINLGKLNFRIFFAYLVPLGDFLAFARDRTDRSAAELVSLMDGATPDSTGALDELQHLSAAIESDSEA
jgi:pyruvate,water dikinase